MDGATTVDAVPAAGVLESPFDDEAFGEQDGALDFILCAIALWFEMGVPDLETVRGPSVVLIFRPFADVEEGLALLTVSFEIIVDDFE